MATELPLPTSHSLRTSRTAHVWAHGPRQAVDEWVILHGYGQRAQEILFPFVGLPAAGRLLAPEGLSRFYRRGFQGDVGASWMTREDREDEISDAIGYLDTARDALGARQPRRRSVLGFSQGGATAARWALRGRLPTDRLVLWCCDLPGDLTPDEMTRLRELELWLVYSREDPLLPVARIEDSLARLKQIGVIPHIHAGIAGHAIEAGDVSTLWELWRRSER